MMSSSPMRCLDIIQTTDILVILYGRVIGSCSDTSNNWNMVIECKSCFHHPLDAYWWLLHLHQQGRFLMNMDRLVIDQIGSIFRMRNMCRLCTPHLFDVLPGEHGRDRGMYRHIMTRLLTYSVRQVGQANAQAYNDRIVDKFRQAEECQLCFHHPFVALLKHIAWLGQGHAQSYQTA